MMGGLLLDPVAPALVCGGAALVAMLRSMPSDRRAAVRALGPLVRANPDAEARTARVAVARIVERAEAHSIASVDRAAPVERFLAAASRELADARDPARFRAWGEDAIAERRERHAAAAAVWTAAADAAPAIGMIGTILGLVRMFAGLGDPAAIGPGMALALTTTLWGIVVANCVAGPIAARLERLSRAETAWQEKALARLSELAEREIVAAPSRVTPIAPRLRAA